MHDRLPSFPKHVFEVNGIWTEYYGKNIDGNFDNQADSNFAWGFYPIKDRSHYDDEKEE